MNAVTGRARVVAILVTAAVVAGIGVGLTTGIPCPSCGMTTSFAWFYHGNLPASFYVQPAGFLAAYLTFAVGFFALYQALTARPVYRLLRLVPLRLSVILALSLLAAFTAGPALEAAHRRLLAVAHLAAAETLAHLPERAFEAAQ